MCGPSHKKYGEGNVYSSQFRFARVPSFPQALREPPASGVALPLAMIPAARKLPLHPPAPISTLHKRK